ncbi:MAG: HAD-IA family hydrolase [Kofleriaceae bacterium]
MLERGVGADRGALAAAAPASWRHYDGLVDSGVDHVRAWHALMTTLLTGANVADPEDHAAWLYRENARANLWRKPIPGMVELARALAQRGARVGVLSNSEGRLAELLDEVGMLDAFEVVVDSGRVGLEKPDRRIFDHARDALGGGSEAIHIGDSWDADIAGARNAGWRAIWFGRRATAVSDAGVAIARDAADTAAVFERWQI